MYVFAESLHLDVDVLAHCQHIVRRSRTSERRSRTSLRCRMMPMRQVTVGVRAARAARVIAVTVFIDTSPWIGAMTLDLNNWEARLVLEAMRSLEAQWNAVIDGTEDEDVQSEYGNDLAQLEMARERIESAACVEFGPGVRVFSREPVGVTPQG